MVPEDSPAEDARSPHPHPGTHTPIPVLTPPPVPTAQSAHGSVLSPGPGPSGPDPSAPPRAVPRGRRSDRGNGPNHRAAGGSERPQRCVRSGCAGTAPCLSFPSRERSECPDVGGKTPLSSYIGAGGLRIQALKDPDGRKEDKRLFQTERGLYYPSDEEPAVPSPHPEPCRGLCHPKAPLAPRCVGGAPGHPQAGRLPAPAAVTRGDRGRRGAALGSPSLPVPGPHLSHSLEIPAQGSRCHREMCSWAAWEVESGCSWVRVLCTRGTRGLRPRAHRTGRCTGFGSCSVGRSS